MGNSGLLIFSPDHLRQSAPELSPITLTSDDPKTDLLRFYCPQWKEVETLVSIALSYYKRSHNGCSHSSAADVLSSFIWKHHVSSSVADPQSADPRQSAEPHSSCRLVISRKLLLTTPPLKSHQAGRHQDTKAARWKQDWQRHYSPHVRG
jgi:hypothetical protein